MIRISKLTYDGLIENLTFTFAGNRPTRVDDAVAASAYGGGFEFKDAVKQGDVEEKLKEIEDTLKIILR